MSDSPKKILVIASSSPSVFHFRGDLIQLLVNKGFLVYCAAPDLKQMYAEKIEDLGAKPINCKIYRTGLNPIKDLKTVWDIKNIINEYAIDLVFPYTIKPVIYGSIAARLSHITVVSLITGLGYTFSNSSLKSRILGRFSALLYRFALKKNSAVIFQNTDDYLLFLKKRIIRRDKVYQIVSGSGINLDKYKFRNEFTLKKGVKFVFVARLIKEKGIHLFLDAAQILKSKYPNSEFHVLGEIPTESPSAIKKSKLVQAVKEGNIINHYWVDDVSSMLATCDVFVLPSFYREGIPRSILEALSVGLPVITTHTPGCKETVINNHNGILIEPKKLKPLVSAMEYYLLHPEKIKEMSINSRAYAEQRFDVNIVNEEIYEIIENALSLEHEVKFS